MGGAFRVAMHQAIRARVVYACPSGGRILTGNKQRHDDVLKWWLAMTGIIAASEKMANAKYLSV
jgi:hypothetical protein